MVRLQPRCRHIARPATSRASRQRDQSETARSTDVDWINQKNLARHPRGLCCRIHAGTGAFVELHAGASHERVQAGRGRVRLGEDHFGASAGRAHPRHRSRVAALVLQRHQRRHRRRVLQPRLRALGLAQDQLRDHHLREVQSHPHRDRRLAQRSEHQRRPPQHHRAHARGGATARGHAACVAAARGAFRSRNSNGRTIRTAGATQAGQTAAARRLLIRSAQAHARRPGGVRASVSRNSSGRSDQNGWGHATWSNSGGAEAAYAQRPGARSASGRRAGVRVAQRQRSNDQNGWGGGNWSSNW